jgi:N-acetylglucosaminyldiphosphoundecaprenol N-acetyl-beta-D-mannosaminyltransferase
VVRWQGMERAPSVRLFGLRMDNLSLEETVSRVNDFIACGGVHQHIVVNVDKIVKADRDSEIREIVNNCDLVNVDGQAVVWASRLLGQPIKERVTGIDLMVRLLAEAAQRGYRVYFLGARKEVVDRVVEEVRSRFPGVLIAGWRDGYFTAAEEPDVAEEISHARPDILFVAITSPRKELFLARWKDRIQAPFVMGVGGSFDVVAGMVRRAPRWMQQAGLEWVFRLMQEPRRMWRRYLVEDMRFLWLLVRERWRTRG